MHASDAAGNGTVRHDGTATSRGIFPGMAPCPLLRASNHDEGHEDRIAAHAARVASDLARIEGSTHATMRAAATTRDEAPARQSKRRIMVGQADGFVRRVNPASMIQRVLRVMRLSPGTTFSPGELCDLLPNAAGVSFGLFPMRSCVSKLAQFGLVEIVSRSPYRVMVRPAQAATTSGATTSGAATAPQAVAS